MTAHLDAWQAARMAGLSAMLTDQARATAHVLLDLLSMLDQDDPGAYQLAAARLAEVGAFEVRPVGVDNVGVDVQHVLNATVALLEYLTVTATGPRHGLDRDGLLVSAREFLEHGRSV